MECHSDSLTCLNLVNLMKFNKVKYKVLHGVRVIQNISRDRGINRLRAGDTSRGKLRHVTAICACSPESQTYPELHQKKYVQQVKGEDSAPLLTWEPYFQSCIQICSPQYVKDVHLLEQIQRRATKIIRELEYLSYGLSLGELR
ncbi:hypothetical protein BTVI_58542 [Pitangus sulphuratus]|nr:hypothetical protein BTVI_58542 [Pitangus sulphuratus]